MRGRLVFLILWMAVPVTAHSHTEIFFPKLFSPAELPNTGFVFLNPDPIISLLNVYLLGPDGSVVFRNEGKIRINPGGQLAQLGSELFPNVTSGGWVYVNNDTEGMQAFWLNYNSGITALDGGEAGGYDLIGADQVIPLVAGETELNIINPNFSIVPVTIGLYGENGQLAGPVTRQLARAGGFQAEVSALFPGVNIADARYIRIRTTGSQIASSALIRGFMVPEESAVVTGINVVARSEMNFPHVINGNLDGHAYTTTIGATNLATAEQSVTITFNSDDGNSVTATRTIPANGSLRETAQSLFGLPAEFRNGWVRVSGTASLTGFTAYADSIAGGFAVVPVGTLQTNLFFSHLADGPPQWQTGLALLNPGTTAAEVTVYAITPAGSLIGAPAQFTLQPGQKIARVIHEWIPETRGVNGGFIYVKTNNVSLYGLELFYTEDLRVLANVSAGKLNAGLIYTPPPQR